MALIDELKEMRESAKKRELERRAEAFEMQTWADVDAKYVRELDTAIAALSSPPVEDPGLREVQLYLDGRLDGYTQAIQSLELEAEKEVAREQLEREPKIPEESLGSSLIAMGYGDDDTPAEHISILTGDPAIEPETGLHGEPVEEAVFIEEINAPHLQSGYDLYAEHLAAVAAMDEAPALNADMQDEREQPVEGYAPVTNPEADAIARAHDYYSPEKVAERNRFNPFAMFRREPEGV